MCVCVYLHAASYFIFTPFLNLPLYEFDKVNRIFLIII